MGEPTVFRGGWCTHPEAMVISGGGWGAVSMPSLFALIDHPRLGPTLFDTGYSTRFFEHTRCLPDKLYAWVTPVTLPPAETAVAQLARLGLAPADVRTVVLSHFHADHVAAAADFPAATYVYAGASLRAVERLAGLRRVMAGFLPGLLPADFAARARPLERELEGALPADLAPLERGHDLAGDGSVWAVALPGHVAGQIGLVVRAQGGDWLFSADASWYRRGIHENRLPHPLVRLITHDWAAYRDTLGRLHALCARRPELRVVPSHCAATFAELAPGRSG